MSSDEELQKLRQRKVAELQAQQQQQQHEQIQRAQNEAEAQKAAVMRKILTPEARQRLQNVKLVRPDFAEQIEPVQASVYHYKVIFKPAVIIPDIDIE